MNDTGVYDKLNKVFFYGFVPQYNSMEEKYKKIILKYIVQLYRRWYYSALVSNTKLTPANFFNYIDKTKIPFVSLGEFDIISQTKGNFADCGVENHFIFDDLRFMSEFSEGGIRLDKNGYIAEDTFEKLSVGLHLKCSFYAVYLLEVLERLGAVVKMPSINTTVYVLKNPTADYDLRCLMDISCEIAADKLNDVFGAEVIDSEEMYAYFIGYTSLDQIVIDMLSARGIDGIEEILGKELKYLDNYEKSVVALAAQLTCALDKWFITVFSFYLRMIQPVFTRRFDFLDEIKLLAELSQNSEIDSRAERALFRCPSLYNLTELGAGVTGVFFKNEQGCIFERTDMLTMLNCALEGARLENSARNADISCKAVDFIDSLKH